MELHIEPIMNVPYQFDFNDGIEKYWRALKMKYRPKLLQKMLENPQSQTPMKDALREVREELVDDSYLTKYIDHGLDKLKTKSNQIRRKRGIKERV